MCKVASALPCPPQTVSSRPRPPSSRPRPLTPRPPTSPPLPRPSPSSLSFSSSPSPGSPSASAAPGATTPPPHAAPPRTRLAPRSPRLKPPPGSVSVRMSSPHWPALTPPSPKITPSLAAHQGRLLGLCRPRSVCEPKGGLARHPHPPPSAAPAHTCLHPPCTAHEHIQGRHPAHPHHTRHPRQHRLSPACVLPRGPGQRLARPTLLTPYSLPRIIRMHCTYHSDTVTAPFGFITIPQQDPSKLLPHRRIPLAFFIPRYPYSVALRLSYCKHAPHTPRRHAVSQRASPLVLPFPVLFSS